MKRRENSKDSKEEEKKNYEEKKEFYSMNPRCKRSDDKILYTKAYEERSINERNFHSEGSLIKRKNSNVTYTKNNWEDEEKKKIPITNLEAGTMGFNAAVAITHGIIKKAPRSVIKENVIVSVVAGYVGGKSVERIIKKPNDSFFDNFSNDDDDGDDKK